MGRCRPTSSWTGSISTSDANAWNCSTNMSFEATLDRLPGVPQWVVADRGLSSYAFREHIWNLGARPAIPPKQNEAPVACPAWVYNNRNYVERLWARLKEWRAIATRYEKTARSFMGVLCLAAALDWIKP